MSDKIKEARDHAEAELAKFASALLIANRARQAARDAYSALQHAERPEGATEWTVTAKPRALSEQDWDDALLFAESNPVGTEKGARPEIIRPADTEDRFRDQSKAKIRPGRQDPLWLVRWEDASLALIRARDEEELMLLLDGEADPNLAGWCPYDGPVCVDFSAPVIVVYRNPENQEDTPEYELLGVNPRLGSGSDGYAGPTMTHSLVATAFCEGNEEPEDIKVEDMVSHFARELMPSQLFRRSVGFRNVRGKVKITFRGPDDADAIS